MLKNLPPSLRQQAVKKIELFQDVGMHRHLKVHKLSGELDDQYSFSVNYKPESFLFICPQNQNLRISPLLEITMFTTNKTKAPTQGTSVLDGSLYTPIILPQR